MMVPIPETGNRRRNRFGKKKINSATEKMNLKCLGSTQYASLRSGRSVWNEQRKESRTEPRNSPNS